MIAVAVEDRGLLRRRELVGGGVVTGTGGGSVEVDGLGGEEAGVGGIGPTGLYVICGSVGGEARVGD